MLYICALISSSKSFYYVLGLWYYIMWHVMWLRCHMPSSSSKIKRKENQYKIKKNKRKEKEKLLVFQHSITMMAMEGDKKNSKTIVSSWRAWDLSSFSLSWTLNEIRSEKLSITLSLGENSESRGTKDGKHLLDLLAMSTKWPLTSEHYQLVRESRAMALWLEGVLCYKSMREYTRWLGGNLWVRSCDLLPSFWR